MSSLQRRLEAFDARRTALLDDLEGLDPAALSVRPRPDAWSLLEIVEHLVLAEKDVLRGLPDPAELRGRRRRMKHHLGYAAVFMILRFGVPVRVPSAAMVPAGGRSLAELRAQWDEHMAWWWRHRTHLERLGRGAGVFRHPVTGPLTPRQALRLQEVHLRRHLSQIRKVRREVAGLSP